MPDVAEHWSCAMCQRRGPLGQAVRALPLSHSMIVDAPFTRKFQGPASAWNWHIYGKTGLRLSMIARKANPTQTDQVPCRTFEVVRSHQNRDENLD